MKWESTTELFVMVCVDSGLWVNPADVSAVQGVAGKHSRVWLRGQSNPFQVNNMTPKQVVERLAIGVQKA